MSSDFVVFLLEFFRMVMMSKIDSQRFGAFQLLKVSNHIESLRIVHPVSGPRTRSRLRLDKLGRSYFLDISFSISSLVRGSLRVRTSAPFSVIRMRSSIRMPIFSSGM